MIDAVVVLLRDLLNAHLRAQSADTGDSAEDEVVLVDGDKLDPISFKSGAVSVLLVNVEEDNTLPQADPFRRTLADRTRAAVAPEVRVNLFVLFVARYRQYERGLARLAAVMQYFQHHRLLDSGNTPGFPAGLDKLVVELVTLPFEEQNELWGALRTTYHPSVLYRVRLVTFAQEDATPLPQVRDIVRTVQHPPRETEPEPEVPDPDRSPANQGG